MNNWRTLTDEALIERLNFSDHAAFTEIFRRYHGALYSFALKRKNKEVQLYERKVDKPIALTPLRQFAFIF